MLHKILRSPVATCSVSCTIQVLNPFLSGSLRDYIVPSALKGLNDVPKIDK